MEHLFKCVTQMILQNYRVTKKMEFYFPEGRCLFLNPEKSFLKQIVCYCLVAKIKRRDLLMIPNYKLILNNFLTIG